MNTGFYTGVSGMVAYQREMDILAHNMANVSTAGYKPTGASFSDLLYTEMDVNAKDHPLVGHGVKVQGQDLKMTQGIPISTGNMTDFSINGEGFFAVNRNGKTEYTRNGAFSISLEGGSKGYLVTPDGAHVLDTSGNPVSIPRSATGGHFNYEGLPNRIGVYLFDNPYGMERTDGSSFIETERSGAPRTIRAQGGADLPYEVVSGTLESSAVDLADEMVNVMLTQRAFQVNAKMVQTADQIEEIVNNLR